VEDDFTCAETADVDFRRSSAGPSHPRVVRAGAATSATPYAMRTPRTATAIFREAGIERSYGLGRRTDHP
jgi:hypothetical protein